MYVCTSFHIVYYCFREEEVNLVFVMAPCDPTSLRDLALFLSNREIMFSSINLVAVSAVL